MQVQVGAVFTSFAIPLGDAPQTLLLQLARRCWNVEVQRASDARVTACIMRPPPLYVDDTLYSGVVLSVAVSGAVDMVSSGSVAAALAMARRLRTLLCVCLRGGDVERVYSHTNDNNDDDTCCLHACTRGGVDLGTLALLEERRLRAYASRGEAAAATAAMSVQTLLPPPRRHNDASAPRVVFFNAVLSPVTHELRRLRVRLRLHAPAHDTWDYQPGHHSRLRRSATHDDDNNNTYTTTTTTTTSSSMRQGTMLLTCDAVLRWLRRVLADEQGNNNNNNRSDNSDNSNSDDNATSTQHDNNANDGAHYHDVDDAHDVDHNNVTTTTTSATTTPVTTPHAHATRQRPAPLPLHPRRRQQQQQQRGGMRAFVQHTRARVRACAVAHAMHALTSHVGVQLTLQWRVADSHDGSRDNEGDDKRATTSDTQDDDATAPRTASLDDHTTMASPSLVLPSSLPSYVVAATTTITTTAASTATSHDDATLPLTQRATTTTTTTTTPTTAQQQQRRGGERVEKVTCTIFATGNVNVTAPSMRALRSVTSHLLLPLMLCCARLS